MRSSANSRMPPLASRRVFLQRSVQTALGVAGGAWLSRLPAGAIEPFQRPGAPRLLLSLAGYSFRDYMKDSTHKRDKQADPAKQIDLFQFVDYCADHGCTGTELTSYYFPKELTTDYLIRLRRHAFLRGVAVSGTAVGNNFAQPKGARRDQEIADVKQWIDRAAILGAPHIRVFAGSPDGISKEEALELCTAALQECSDYAGTRGIMLGLENHGGIVSEPADLLKIIRGVKSPWLGVNLDTGNYFTEDPYGDMTQLAPYAVNVQIKPEIGRRRDGRVQKEPADLPRVVKIIRDANYQGYLALEYESAEDPWTAVPRLLKQLAGLFAA